MDYMEAQPALAKNLIKGDRVAAERLWADLAKKVNAKRPPQKDTIGWKKVRNQMSYIICCLGVHLHVCMFLLKVWADWKTTIRKKLAHNKAQLRTT